MIFVNLKDQNEFDEMIDGMNAAKSTKVEYKEPRAPNIIINEEWFENNVNNMFEEPKRNYKVVTGNLV